MTTNFDDPLRGSPEDGGQGGSRIKDQAQEVAGTAQAQGGRMASVVKDEAGTVVDEAKRQTADLVAQAREELEQQSLAQRDRLVETLRDFSHDIEQMLAGQGGGDGLAASLAREVAERARAVTSSLQDRQPGEILNDVRGFARRRPGTFLLGALAAGVVTGRLVRGAKDSGAAGASDQSGGVWHAATAGGDTVPRMPTVPPVPTVPTAPTVPTVPTVPPPAYPAGGTAAGTPTSGVTADPAGLPPAEATAAGTPAATDPVDGPLAPDAGAMPPTDGPHGGGVR